MDHRHRTRDVDLSGVVPGRRETVRRRMAALDEYDGLRKRTWQDLARLSEPLGLAPASFHRLWRSWRSVRDPLALQGVTRSRGLRNATGDGDYVRDLLRDIPPGASIEQDVLAIERLAGEQDVTVRSRSALRRLVREIREESARLPLADAPDDLIAVDMVPIELAVTANGTAMLPLATLILHPRSGTVLAAALSLGEPSPALAASALAGWLDGMPTADAGTRVRHLLIPGTHDPAWHDLFRVFDRHGIDRRGPNGRRLPAGPIAIDSVGRTLLGLDVRPRMVHRRPEDRRPLTRSARITEPLSLAEAQIAVDERIASAPACPLIIADRSAIVIELKAVFGL